MNPEPRRGAEVSSSFRPAELQNAELGLFSLTVFHLTAVSITTRLGLIKGRLNMHVSFIYVFITTAEKIFSVEASSHGQQ